MPPGLREKFLAKSETLLCEYDRVVTDFNGCSVDAQEAEILSNVN
jgi:hypothetical protein